ncbi:MAG: hypothetical protein ACI4S4_06845, partial [Candidatus Ornithospirochaeta sp.]
RKGDRDTREGGRRYTNMTEERLMPLVPSGLETVKTWESSDVRKDMDYRWLNVLFRKKSVPAQAG